MTDATTTKDPEGLFLDLSSAQKLLSYLASRPWIEVQGLIPLVQGAPAGAPVESPKQD